MILGGYGQFATSLASSPYPLAIRFGHCVEKISYSQDRGRTTPEPEGKPIAITCTNGEVIEADAAVITVSLGVLKSGTIEFEPNLPQHKEEAIARLGFGLLNKVQEGTSIANSRSYSFSSMNFGIPMLTSLAASELQLLETY
jgi:hypothetical protein